MSFQILIDMNLSPEWVAFLEQHNWRATHWSQVGVPTAPDYAIMEWAEANQAIVFTHDLDFGTILALSNRARPSVIQVRAQNVMPEHLGKIVLAALTQYENLLQEGALMIVDETTLRVRALPLHTTN